ncbi:MAG: (2Fe-2S)-binding protein [Porticoccaceae bacterium]
MYVCLCRGVTQKQIRREVLDGAVTYDAIQERLEVGLCCGTCSDTAQEVIADTISTSLVAKNAMDNQGAVVQIEHNVIQMWSPVRRAS